MKKISKKKLCLYIKKACICSFQKKMLSNLTRVLIYLLTKCVLVDGFKDSCVLQIL